MSISIGEALGRARQLGLDRLDAQLLLGHVLQRPRSWILAHDETLLTTSQHNTLDALTQRRAQGEPLAYLTGEKEFHGLMLEVTPAVLIPRPDTETLVDWALALLKSGPAHPRVLDLGTGSGAIAIALKYRHAAAHVTALDSSVDALAVARRNATRLKLDLHLLHSDWFAAVHGKRYDLVASNPPYIAEGDAHLPALGHEPRLALTSGRDGLDALRILATQAPNYLHTGGWLLLEHGHDQSTAVQELLRSQHFKAVQTRSDLAGIGRCTGGQWL